MAKQFELPCVALEYICVNSYQSYKNSVVVDGDAGSGVIEEDGEFRINNSDWSNAVVFKSYTGGEVRKITMHGTGSEDGTFTLIRGDGLKISKITAVSYDGSETNVLEIE